MKEMLSIIRKWSHPEIRMWVSNKEIGMAMDLSQFIDSVKKEMGSVTWVFTEAEFNRRFDKAVETVIEEVKKQTVKIVV